MNLIAFILILFGLQTVCFYAGKKSAEGLNNQDDYFLAGKGIKFFPLMMTFLATQMGGGLILGSAEEAYHYGWAVLFYPLGAAMGLAVLGFGVGRQMAQFKISTVAQIFEVVFGSTTLKKIASTLSILSLFMILVAQVIASSKFMVSIGFDHIGWFIAFWAIVILYTSLGGLKAVVATDVIQAAFFAVVFALCFFIAYSSSGSGPLSVNFNKEDIAFSTDKLYGWLLMPLMFMVVEQDMGQRCFAADSPKTVSKATLCAAFITMILSVVPIYFGVTAKDLNLEIPTGSSVLMEAVKQLTSPIITAFMATAILAAIISTADSLINAISSNVAQDFNVSVFKKKDNIKASQAISGAIAVAAIFFSFYFNNIVDLLIQSYELSVSCLFIPILIALFKKTKGNTLAAALSVAFGALGFALLRVYPVELPKEIVSVGLSLIGYCVGDVLAAIVPFEKAEHQL